jgi:hypothetical protein
LAHIIDCQLFILNFITVIFGKEHINNAFYWWSGQRILKCADRNYCLRSWPDITVDKQATGCSFSLQVFKN